MPVEKGDAILIDYVTKIKETGEIFDTTLGEEAKKGGILKENTVYEPMLVIVGEGWVLKGLDDSLVGLEENKPTTIEISPENGFGLRDPSKIKLVPLRKFRGQKVSPYPGAQIEVDEKLAIVRSVGAGRVQVDFNSPLAGKTLVYDLTVKEIIKGKVERIKVIMHRRIPTVDIQKIKFRTIAKRVSIELPEEAYYLEGIQFAKRGVAADIQKYLPEFEKITFTENYQKEEAKSSTTEPSQEQENDQEDTLSAQ